MNLHLAEVLYALCALLLAVGSLWLTIREGRSTSVRWFVATSLALLIWVVTLFLFGRSNDPDFILLVGRANFAAVSLAVYFGWRFVRALAQHPQRPMEIYGSWLSLLLAGVALTTSLIDQAEIVVADGRHITVYGFLFPLYVLHVMAFLAASIWTAFSASGHKSASSKQRSSLHDQLLLIGWGIVITGTISLVSNALLPAVLGDFRWIDIGPISTLVFLICVAYAVVRHHLFDIRVFVRRTLVLGVTLSFVLAAYSALVLLATDTFASSESGGVTRFGVLFLAFSFDPIRRFLEKRIDKLLFPEQVRRRYSP